MNDKVTLMTSGVNAGMHPLYREFWAEDVDGLNSLDTEPLAMGTVCLVVSTGQIFILSSKASGKIWMEL